MHLTPPIGGGYYSWQAGCGYEIVATYKLWYNDDMDDRVLEATAAKKIERRGGKRPGAGRPRLYNRAVPQVNLSKQLQLEVEAGLDILSKNYADLITLAIERAKAGSNSMLIFLLRLPFDVVDLKSTSDTPFASARERWTRTETVEVTRPIGTEQEEKDTGIIEAPAHRLLS